MKESLRLSQSFAISLLAVVVIRRLLLHAANVDERIVKGVKVDEGKLEAVSEFYYLTAGGGCDLVAAVTRCKCAPTAATSHHHNLILVNRGWMYSTCVRSVMLQRLRP